jgi:TRAP-type C4-dicarboxylate transport system permease large subunit
MPVFQVGAVVVGLATATESAGLGVLYALLIGLFVIRGLKAESNPRPFAR